MHIVMHEGAAVAATWEESAALAISRQLEDSTVEARPDGVDYREAAAILARQCERLGLSIEWQFVPLSQSRNAGGKWQSLNWRARLLRNGKALQGLDSVDYSQGAAYAPAHKIPFQRFNNNERQRARAIAWECENGKAAKVDQFGEVATWGHKPLAPPATADLVAALANDSSVLDYATFEEWAADLGFDPDSRKAESDYRACVATAVALRAAVGPYEMESLRALVNSL